MEKPIEVKDSPKTQPKPSHTKEPTKAIIVSSSDMPSPPSTTAEEEEAEKEKEVEEEEFDPLIHMVQKVVRELDFNEDADDEEDDEEVPLVQRKRMRT